MKIIGHRGARGLAPENTIAGIQKALEYHVDIIEFDVRVTKDGIPILHHNPQLVDQSGNKLSVSGHTYSELKEHKDDLAMLDEALSVVHGRAPIYVEVKTKVRVAPIVEVLRKYKHPYLLASKSQKTLLKLHAAMPKVAKIVIESWSGVRAVYRAKQVDTKFIAMNQLFLWSGFIRSMRHRGYELYAYTLNNPKRARYWTRYGLAGVVTDFPDRFQNKKQ
ncbi:glycerophosphodiester phosphodiesterase [Candidatus Saccharibacteria bacterium]|nr:glycerophosphodiester phosphodiesterase [Candidatus Saccharibacteria bacterium]